MSRSREPAPSGWRALANGLLDLVVAQHCGGCGQPGVPWCSACAATVAGPPLRLLAPVPTRAAAAHDGPAGRAVVAFKDDGCRRLAGPLSQLLAGAVVAVAADMPLPLGTGRGSLVGWELRPPVADEPGPRSAIWLVPVPARASSRRRRGFDPMAVLAGRAAAQMRRSGLSAHRLRALVVTRDSRDQVGLGRAERLANVTATIGRRRPGGRAGGQLPAGLLVVVDDVATTGATLAEARRALGPEARGRMASATVTRATRGPGHGIG